MGWKKDNTEFIVGDVSYKNDSTNSRIKLDEGYAPLINNFEVKGNIDEWKKILDIYKTPEHADFALAIMTGFGAPMFHFTGFDGGVFSLNGTSGAGKSTILSVIHSIYGKPTCNTLLKKDTSNSKAAVLSVYNNLPITFDEITTISGEEASQLIFDVTDGRDKQRLNSDATLKATVRTWGLILFTTTNRSLTQLVLAYKPEASGEMMRIMERRVEALNQMEFAQARKKFEPLKENYGLAGQSLIPWYVENLEEAVRLLNEFVDKVSDAVSGQIPERFWLSMCGTALLGCHVGSLLNLHNFKIQDIFDQCCSVILESRATTAAHAKRSIDILSDFLNNSIGRTLVVRESKKSVEILVKPRGELAIRSELVSQRTYIDCSVLMQYCATNAYDFGQTQKELLSSKVLLRADATKALGEGTEYFSGQTKVWVIDTAHNLMSGVVPLTLQGKEDSAEEAVG